MSDAGDRSGPGTDRGPTPRRPTADARSDGGDGESSWRLFVRDLLTSALAVLVVGAYLFAVSGVWPPLVAVESGSMLPNMERNDLVFVMEETRFPGGDAIGNTGVVTAAAAEGTDYTKFGGPGDVVVFQPNGSAEATPIIHRAMFYVEDGERWYERADESFVGGADSCAELANCPAPHEGFVTKGDANGNYDQARPDVISRPVRAEWVVGTAEVKIPGLGWLRLQT